MSSGTGTGNSHGLRHRVTAQPGTSLNWWSRSRATRAPAEARPPVPTRWCRLAVVTGAESGGGALPELTLSPGAVPDRSLVPASPSQPHQFNGLQPSLHQDGRGALALYVNQGDTTIPVVAITIAGNGFVSKLQSDTSITGGHAERATLENARKVSGSGRHIIPRSTDATISSDTGSRGGLDSATYHPTDVVSSRTVPDSGTRADATIPVRCDPQEFAFRKIESNGRHRALYD